MKPRRRDAEALAWLTRLGFEARPLPDEESREAKEGLIAALQGDSLLPPGFLFRDYLGQSGPFLWDHLFKCQVSEERVRSRLSSGSGYLAFFDEAPSVFACRSVGPLTEIPQLDLSLLDLQTWEVIAFNHEGYPPMLHRLSPPHRPHGLRPRVEAFLPESLAEHSAD